MSHAEQIALKLCDNDWWNDLNDLVPNAIPNQKTERELILKRLHYWIANYEGNMIQESPMYSVQLGRQVMEIVDKALLKTI